MKKNYVELQIEICTFDPATLFNLNTSSGNNDIYGVYGDDNAGKDIW